MINDCLHHLYRKNTNGNFVANHVPVRAFCFDAEKRQDKNSPNRRFRQANPIPFCFSATQFSFFTDV
jgi:hypothetical protein